MSKISTTTVIFDRSQRLELSGALPFFSSRFPPRITVKNIDGDSAWIAEAVTALEKIYNCTVSISLNGSNSGTVTISKNGGDYPLDFVTINGSVSTE